MADLDVLVHVFDSIIDGDRFCIHCNHWSLLSAPVCPARVQQALDAAREEGRRAGLEESKKVCTDAAKRYKHGLDGQVGEDLAESEGFIHGLESAAMWIGLLLDPPEVAAKDVESWLKGDTDG
ncbi:MAG: hypothetical protein GY913_21615 [Proteobacteria bacterium]|nr:hypothetical protein [Actinomycetes bacterium]MCP4919508.1 hypothetical protein [Pseudomonadota bacterium]